MKTSIPKSQKPRQPRARAARSNVPRARVTIRTILVPTDFSPASLKALAYGCAVAKKFSATLHLLHVNDVQFEEPALVPFLAAGMELDQKMRRRLQLVAAKCAVRVTPARIHVRKGKAFDQICREAKHLSADLIIISTHGYTGLKHVLLGSTAERVVRHATCPVLVVRDFVSGGGNGAREREAFRLTKILVPVDFSEYSRQALTHAVALAKQFGSKVTLLHSVYPHYYATNSDYTVYDLPVLMESLREGAEKQMQDLVRQTAFSGVPFESQVTVGFPSETILQVAADAGADLIVSSTHGRTGLKRALIGSTAEQMVRFAKCPVLVVPCIPGPRKP